jgi:hypothetical protein
MSYMTLIPMTRNYSMHSMPLERRHNVKGRQDSEGANMSMAVVHLNNKGWLGWKVHKVKLAAGTNHSNANKDRHGPVVNKGQTSKNSYR